MNDTKEQFRQDFSQEFYSATSEQFGGAGITSRELGVLKSLYAATKESLFGDTPVGKLSKEDKGLIRNLVVGRIVEEGWPAPAKVEARDLAEAAVANACGVAERLIEKRGVEASPDTFFSYTTKNQFDRFVAMILIRAGKIKKGGALYEEWHSPQAKDPDYENPDVKYPESLDATQIHGVGKPHRYWPAQLLRIMEELRLGEMSEEKKEKLKAGDSPARRYTILWTNYRKIIGGAESVDGVAVGVAVKTMEILHKRGLEDDQIVELIIAGYNPKGPMGEYGNISQAHDIWREILNRTKESKAGIAHLETGLRSRLEEEMRAVGHSFKHVATGG